MKLKAIQNTFQTTLSGIYSKEEIDTIFFMLNEAYYGITRLQLALNTNLELENTDAILKALQALKAEKPIQYILGETEFFGLNFKVNQHVLIPRPETEELVAWVLKWYSKLNSASQSLKILDVGTGSGCIAITLAKKIPKASVFALDVSGNALTVAKQNAVLNNVDVTCVEASILKPDTANKLPDFDVIISNPPYVRMQEKELMKPNVLNNEPHLALFVENNNPLLFYNAICKFASNKLKENGALFFEINEYLGEEMKQLLHNYNFKNIELKQDIFKKERMIKGVY
ncbi:peptide chain release factor N(5)-glutamine methyltransferase [Seonamhaeicola algicola]|uniref:Release factor glutamine methyltransferase n=1 Tax=Seonamhaeicola algicola TaxID=1719036 RepID=A0A5C7AZT4_9FLAO|nr:peptide chain release factor N(5)-glutamine methyltransferase [Seonamhaeicola algicola]TXE11965.1 peptide chain release factor N(5)-glutamine methyltransferase [Seonamhaeicola algicola]